MEQMGQLDTTDAAAVKAVYDSIDNAIETIKVSFIMHSSKKSVIQIPTIQRRAPPLGGCPLFCGFIASLRLDFKINSIRKGRI